MLMLMRKVQRFPKIFLMILLVACVCGCPSTFTHRDIQKDFNNAVQAENRQSVESIGAITSSSQAEYQDVLQRLDDKYIQALDPKLQMNAYAMKAVAQWRTGKIDDAKTTAKKGLALQNVPSSPRDKMVLQIIQPLVNEQYLRVRYRQLPEPQRVSLTDYQKFYAKDFADAARDLKQYAAQATPDLPEDVLFYVYYQRWRVLQDWNTVINHLWDGKNFKSDESTNIQDQARKDAAIEEEIKKQKEQIPQGHWLRIYMETKEKQ